MVILWLILCFFSCISAYKMITPNQWKRLQSYIVSVDTTESMREKIHYILFERHIPLVYGITNAFRATHYRKSKNIDKGDMFSHACKGLYDAVKKYNGKSSFVKYANIYINGELYNCLTVNNPISIMSKQQRRRKVENASLEYFEMRKNIYLDKRDFLPSVKQIPSEMVYLYMETWNKINNFSPFVKRCFYLKFDFYFNKVRSNRHVAELMCCQEEWVRRNIATHTQLLTKNYTRIYTE